MAFHRRTVRTVARYAIVYGLGLLIVLFSILPLLWGVATALKLPSEVYTFPPVWIPKTITFENFVSVVHNPNMIRSFLNTLLIASATTAAALVVGVLGGYGFARYRFPGRNTLLWSVLFTKLFPRVVVIVPFFVTVTPSKLLAGSATELIAVWIDAAVAVATVIGELVTVPVVVAMEIVNDVPELKVRR
jgi:ABC-type glycerol-3-phosphate transport system permease component